MKKSDSAEFNNTPDSDDDSDDSPFTLTKAALAVADHTVDFAIPLCDVWKSNRLTPLAVSIQAIAKSAGYTIFCRDTQSQGDDVSFDLGRRQE